MDDFEKELKAGYLEEAGQLLQDAEQCFLSLENATEDPAIIDKLFRLAHNLKGSARAVGFTDIAEFTHQLESLLLKIKNKEMKVRGSTVNLLLQCNDHLRYMVDTSKNNMDARIDSSALMNEIQKHVNGEVAEEGEVVIPAAVAVPPIIAPVVSQAILVAATPVVEPVVAPPVAPLPVQTLAESWPGLADESVAPEKPAAPKPAQAAPKLTLVQALTPVVPPVQSVVDSAGQPPQTGTAVAVQDESIRVSLKRIERLMNNVGELVILQAVLNQQKFHVQSLLVQKTIDQLAKISPEDLRPTVSFESLASDTVKPVVPTLFSPEEVRVVSRKPGQFQYIIRKRLQ